MKIPGGYLHGKWWGPKNVRPVLGLHGFLDNCGVFDRLIPLLPKEYSYLVFDLPGHGYSFKYPPGMVYSYYDFVVLIERIRREYGWEKISYMGHSFASLIGFFYCAMYPDNLDLVLALECFEPYLIKAPIMMKMCLNEFFANEDEEQARDASQEPPSYAYPELVDRLVQEAFGSVNEEHAKYLLLRNVRPSKKYPKKYYFDHDRKLKGMYRASRHHEDILYMSKKIKMPILYIITDDSYVKAANYEKNTPLREFLQKNNPDFHIHYGPGTHHFLLNQPEDYAGVIGEFLRKYRPIVSKL